MSASCNLLRSSCSPSCMAPAKYALKFKGYNIVQHQPLFKTEFMERKNCSKINVGGYQNYFYDNSHNKHFERWGFTTPKCANIEDPQVEDYNLMNQSTRQMDSLKIFYAFTRPHAFIGIASIILSTSLIAVERSSDFSLSLLISVLQVLFAYFWMAVYVSGINQIFDIEIDKINKPYLPLPSGKMTMKTAIFVTSWSAFMAFATSISSGSMPLIWSIFLMFIHFSAYSAKLPFLRWKGNAIGAIYTIFVSMGIVLPVTTYLHIQMHCFGRQANFPRPLVLGVISLSLFFIVEAIVKDIPDLDGDQKFGIRSIATILGPKKAFWTCVCLLEIGYTIAIVFGATSTVMWSKLITILGHVMLSFYLRKQANSIDLKNKDSVSSFYKLVWKLVSAECLLIPLLR